MRWSSHSIRSGSSPTRNCVSSRSMIVWIAGSVGPGRLADADEALVGLDLDDQAGGGLADSARPLRAARGAGTRTAVVFTLVIRKGACTLGRARGIVNHPEIVNNRPRP